jgi:DNA-binding YbaB/EbfC family protein
MVRKIRGPAPARPGGPPAAGKPNAMLGQLQQMQEQMVATQEALGKETVESSAGGGAVNVVMTGHQVVQSLKLNPEIVSADDVELLQDLIVVAINDAVAKSRKLAEERMSPLTGGLQGMGLF